jgi:4-oxalocrotonate tautomerase
MTMMEGRTDEQKDALIGRLSEAASKHMGCPLEEVRMVIYEVSKNEWGIAGESVAGREREGSG